MVVLAMIGSRRLTRIGNRGEQSHGQPVQCIVVGKDGGKLQVAGDQGAVGTKTIGAGATRAPSGYQAEPTTAAPAASASSSTVRATAAHPLLREVRLPGGAGQPRPRRHLRVCAPDHHPGRHHRPSAPSRDRRTRRYRRMELARRPAEAPPWRGLVLPGERVPTGPSAGSAASGRRPAAPRGPAAFGLRLPDVVQRDLQVGPHAGRDEEVEEQGDPAVDRLLAAERRGALTRLVPFQ